MKPLVALALLFTATPAFAARTTVVWYNGNGGYEPGLSSSGFHSQMLAAGASSSTSTTSWPALTNVKLLLLGVNTSSFSTSQINDMKTMLADGGTIVVVGEHSTYSSGHHANLNSVLSNLGANSRLNNATSYDAGCIQTSSVATSTTWTSGTSTMQYAYSSNISVGSGASVLYRGRSGQNLATVEGGKNILVWSDSNAFGGCSGYSADTQRAWRNLYTGGCVSSTYYRDADGDSWGGTTTTTACTAPTGYVARTGDCNDSVASIYPGATEVTGDEVDQSCDGREICFADADNDGWRLTTTVSSSDVDCADSGEARASEPTLDCDDADALTYPGATEIIADGRDQSCDGRETCYTDADGDRWRTSVTLVSSDPDCADPGEALSSTPATDCDDGDRFTFPGATEVIADEKDQSCDGREICFQDGDDDGWRTSLTVASSDIDCRDGGEANRLEPDGDCNDADKTVYPGAPEIAYDGIDQDCNGDDLCDVDLDGYDADAGACRGADCDDEDAKINPSVDETWYDGVDADCDGWSDFDADYDGYEAEDYGGDDCDDTDRKVNPGADEIWYDGNDQDCDGRSDYDQDKDGFDSDEYGGEDCVDVDDSVYPGAPELPDGIDNDCNGVDEDDDTDGDGLADELELDLGTDPLDADSDGDGLLDGVEVGEDSENPADTDADGLIDALDVDDDGDDILTAEELRDGAPVDTDGDGDPDHLDTDSDGDGYSDKVEGTVDTDRDQIPDYLDLDSDDDTRLDVDERDTDTDGDGADDRVDPDDDGDGFASAEERSWEPDLDGDGEPNELDPDADGDTIPDAEEGSGDADCDDVPNVRDANDLDGPCTSSSLALHYQSGACATGPAAPASGAAWLAALGLVMLGRRRRAGA